MKSLIFPLLLLGFGCGDLAADSADAAEAIDAAAEAIDAAAEVIDAAVPDARPLRSCTTANANTVFLNTNGGAYTSDGTLSPANNVTPIIQQNGSVLPWNVTPTIKADVFECLRETFKDFNVVFTDTEPTEPYHEVVITSSTSGGLFFPGTSTIGQLVCETTDNSIVFVFTNFSDDPLVVCQSAASVLGFTQGLTRVKEACEDVMTNTFQCAGRVPFLNAPQTCADSSGTVIDCRCTNGIETQNSHAKLLGSFGACPSTAL